MLLSKASSAWLLCYAHLITAQYIPPIIPNFKPEPPRPVPKYMVDNERNTYGAAPDRNIINGPNVSVNFLQAVGNSTARSIGKRQGGSFWVADVQHGQSPFAADAANYKIYRNVKVSHMFPASLSIHLTNDDRTTVLLATAARMIQKPSTTPS